MGIADDIKPRKYRRIVERAEKERAEKIAHADESLFTSRSYDDDFFAGTPIDHENRPKQKDHSKKKKATVENKSHSWVYTLIIILVIGLLIAVIIWQNYSTIHKFFDGSYKEENDQSLQEIIGDKVTNDGDEINSEEMAEEPIQNDNQQPAIDKSTISISVLNGSGIKLAAKNLADILIADSFNVDYTGNARSFNYQNTIIYYHTGKEAEAHLVKSTLDTNYQTTTEQSDSVTGNLYDIVVVAGKN